MIRELLTSFTGYPGLFVFCAVSGLIVPLPEDISLLYAGNRLQSGEMALVPTLAVAIAGVMTRDLIAYGAGRLLGDWLLSRVWIRGLFGKRKLDMARRVVQNRGSSAVLVGRFFVGARAPIFLVAGAAGVPLRKFLLWNFLGLLVAVPGVVLLGYIFGAPLAEGAMWVVTQSRGLLILALLAACGWLLWRVRANQRERASNPEVEASTSVPRML